MTREEYAAYRQTPQWFDLVSQLHVRAGGRCQGTRLARSDVYRDHEQRCTATSHLHAHHVCYDRLGHEDLNDLILLCVCCHLVAHLMSVECARCGVQALEDWEAWEVVNDLSVEELMAVHVFAHTFNVARYEIGHWPFCAECYDFISQDG